MKQSDLEASFRQMLLIRRAEEALQQLYKDGHVPGFLHLSIGQEAVPTGISLNLTPADTISSNHRGHGHTLAKGVDLDGFFAEILGKETGLCTGRGGSMHVADISVGMLGANGIVGAGLPITLGSALAHKMQKTNNISVVYFGDGALAEGLVHECFNIAALWNLPVLFACENNGWSEFSATDTQIATSVPKLATAFGITCKTVDGNDVSAVADTAGRLIKAMRKTTGPAILECQTTRVRGHFEGDRQDYRDPSEIEGLSARDPLVLTRARLESADIKPGWFDEVEASVTSDIADAVESALAAPLPDVSGITSDVYTQVGI